MPKPLPIEPDADPNGSPDRVPKSTISGRRVIGNSIRRLVGGFFLGWYLCKKRFILAKITRIAAKVKAQLRPGRITSHNENPSLVALGKKLLGILCWDNLIF